MKFCLQILFLFLLINSLAFSQWTNQNPVPNNNDLWSVFFADDSTGWLIDKGESLLVTIYFWYCA